MKRFRKVTAAFVAIGCMSIALAGCGSSTSKDASDKPVNGGTLTYATDVQPTAGGINPYKSVAFASENVFVQLYDALLTRNEQGKIEPSLATEYKQVNDLTYDFTLRKGVKFSDGSAMTADDVVYSYQQMIAPGAGQRSYLAGLDSIQAVDESHVEFKFSQPNAGFLNLVSNNSLTPIVSKAWFEKASDTQRQREAMGTGPFQLDSWKDQVDITLKRNQNYWGPRPHIDTLVFKIIPDESARLAAVQQKQAQAGWLRDPQLADQGKNSGLSMGANASTRNLELFVNAESGPLSSTPIRQALSKGIDREALIKSVVFGHGEESFVVPVGDPAWGVKPTKSTPNYAYDPSGAKKLVAKSGLSNVSVPLYYASDASFSLDVPLYEMMKEQLNKVGINLELNAIPWSEVLTRYTQGDWDGLVSVPGVYYGEPSVYLNFLAKGSPYNKISNVEGKAGDLYEKMLTVSDTKERKDLVAQINDQIAQDALMIVPYAQPQRQELWSSSLKGYSVDPYTKRMNLKNAWIAQ
jgi:peptide/nickel transport system substrate-binding protein